VEEYSILRKIPLISINCVGFYSYFRVHLPGSFPIVDTHPDSTATTDLRLLSPWPELSNLAQDMTNNIDSLDAHAHGHIPYVLLLLHYLEQWKKTHNGDTPQTYADKIAFRKLVAAAARTDNPDGGEENFDEASAAVLKTISTPSLSSSVREVFEYTPNQVRTLMLNHSAYG
jgi:NEDD8-activating enzyme E1 regulatory subunit